MNYNLLIFLIFVLVITVYLTQISIKRLNAFGNFLKKSSWFIFNNKLAQEILEISKGSKKISSKSFSLTNDNFKIFI
jgi:hypothetical protein